MKILGIDLGGTKSLFGVIDEKGKIIEKIKINTLVSHGVNTMLETISQYVQYFVDKYKVKAIGVASAGRINVNSGTVHYATNNLPNWTGVNLKKILEKEFKIPVFVDNDVNCAGIGEKWIGRAENTQSFICLTLGTGIAGAVFENNTLIRGKNWSAGEIGHTILYPFGKKCNCGQEGCLEQYCSGTALVNRYNEENDSEKIKSGEEFFEYLDNGDVLAKKILNDFVNSLSIAIINMQNVLNPEKFIIGGGLIDTKKIWWDDLINAIKRNGNPTINCPIILPAKLKNDAGIIGAAKLAFENIK